jgi:hypothetical protein
MSAYREHLAHDPFRFIAKALAKLVEVFEV